MIAAFARRMDRIGSRWSAAAFLRPRSRSPPSTIPTVTVPTVTVPPVDRAAVRAAAAAGSAGADRPGRDVAVRASAAPESAGAGRAAAAEARGHRAALVHGAPALRAPAAPVRAGGPERARLACIGSGWPATGSPGAGRTSSDGRRSSSCCAAERSSSSSSSEIAPELPPHRAVPRPGPPRRQPSSARQPGRTPFALARHVQDRGTDAPGWPNDLRHAARGRRAREPRRDPNGRGAPTCARKPPASGSGSFSSASDPPAGSRPGAAEPKKGRRSRRRHRGVLGANVLSGGRSQPSKGIPIWLTVLFGFAIGLLVAAALFPKAAPEGLAVSLACGMTGAVTLLITIAYLAL